MLYVLYNILITVDKNICHLDICDTENVDALWDILDEQKQLFNESIQSNCQLSFEKVV